LFPCKGLAEFGSDKIGADIADIDYNANAGEDITNHLHAYSCSQNLGRIWAGQNCLAETKLELDRIGAGIDDLRKEVEVEGRSME
jgi:hypothetical protein